MKNTKSFQVKSSRLVLKHNTITGSKKFYLNDIIILERGSNFFEMKNHHDLFIEDEMFRLVVIPKLFGCGFIYRLEDGEGGEVLLKEVDDSNGNERVLGENGNV